MKPVEFWDSTVYEVHLYIEAHATREIRRRELLAWHACHVMSPWVKGRLTPKMLYPEGFQCEGVDDEDFLTDEEFGAAVAKAQAFWNS